MTPSASNLSSPQPVRMRDIAEMAGVHVTAVSAVLSPRATNRTRVSAETAKKIQEIAARLNYRPHFHAQVMRKRKTGLIALIEFSRSEISTLRTIEAAHIVRNQGYQALATNVFWHHESGEGLGIRAAIDHVLDARVEGVILVMPTAGLSPAYVREIQNAGIPCVAFDGVRIPDVPQVRVDVAAGAEMLTRHLIELGHRRLALLSAWSTPDRDANTCWPIIERVEGFKSAIQQAGGIVVDGLASLKSLGDSVPLAGVTLINDPKSPHWVYLNDSEAGYHAACRLFDSGAVPDALFCSNDHYALGALRACFERKIKVPKQIAVAGFAGEAHTRFFSPALTTVDTLAAEAGKAALGLLFEIMRGERPAKDDTLLKVPCRLIVRESCGASRVQPISSSLPIV